MRRILNTLLAALALFPGIAQARTHQDPLPPVSKWNVDWGDKSCVLQRVFGKDKDLMMLRFLTFAPESSYQIQLVGKQISFDQPKREVEFAFLPGPASKVGAQLGTTNDGQRTIVFSAQIANDLQEATAINARVRSEASKQDSSDRASYSVPLAGDVTGFSVAQGTHKIELATGPLDKPLVALRQCANNLLTKWGIDPAVQVKVVSKAKPLDMAKLVRAIQDVYPVGAAVAGHQGRVNAVVTVDAQGQPIGCRVPLSQNDRIFDDQVCKVLSRTAYQPAELANGTPVIGYWTLTTIYTLN